MSGPDVLDNTPWWLPGVTTSGGGAGLLVARCDAFGMESGGPRHLEGGFYGANALGPHAWQCKARADGRFTMSCRHGHKGQPQRLCSGHVRMIRKRMSGVCPACAHPPAELAIQEAMQRTQHKAFGARDGVELSRVESQLWNLQDKLNELVERGVVHKCALTLTEVS